MAQKVSAGICSTGIAGFDLVLNGGIPRNRMYLLQGEPGTGKTTLGMQFLIEGARQGERCLYITFSETSTELQAVALSHGWDLSKIDMLELSAIEDQLKPEFQNTVFHPSEVEMNEMITVIQREVERVKPSRIIFDSVSEMRILAETSLRYRRQMLALKQYFVNKDSTVILLDDMSASTGDLHVHSIVHGVFSLQKLHPEFGTERRRLNVVKLRGVQFSGGFHDYIIRPGGVVVFPRMISADHEHDHRNQKFSSNLPALDSLLGGGLDAGTSTLFLGPAGTAKSTITILYAIAAAERGDTVMIFSFEESMNTLLSRTKAIGLDLEKHIKSKKIMIRKVDPAQLTPGEFTEHIRESVIEKGVSMVVIDSLNGFLHAMPQEDFLTLQLHELLAFLNKNGVATVMVLAQQGMLGPMMNTPIDLTYLADTVVITRFFESKGAVKKAISVIKKRGGFHETTIRELQITQGKGVVVGPPLINFQGVLTGIPQLLGELSAVDTSNKHV